MSALDDIEARCVAIAYAMDDCDERDYALLEVVGAAARERFIEADPRSYRSLAWLGFCRAACATFNRRMRHLVGHCHMCASQQPDGSIQLFYAGGITRRRNPQARCLDIRFIKS